MTEVLNNKESREWEIPLRRIKTLVDSHLGTDFDSAASLQRGAADISRKPFDPHADYFTEYFVRVRSDPDEHEWVDLSSGEDRTSSTFTELDFTYTRTTDSIGYSRLEVVPEHWKKGKPPRDGQEIGLLTLLYENLEIELSS